LNHDLAPNLYFSHVYAYDFYYVHYVFDELLESAFIHYY